MKRFLRVMSFMSFRSLEFSDFFHEWSLILIVNTDRCQWDKIAVVYLKGVIEKTDMSDIVTVSFLSVSGEPWQYGCYTKSVNLWHACGNIHAPPFFSDVLRLLRWHDSVLIVFFFAMYLSHPRNERFSCSIRSEKKTFESRDHLIRRHDVAASLTSDRQHA